MTRNTLGSHRIGHAFNAAREHGRIAFAPYIVAGFPDVDSSIRVAIAALDSGADLLEIGLPYSDPLADGVTLQRASAAALANGASLDKSLDVVEAVTRARPDKPVLVMGYANQFLGPRGASAIASRLATAGAAGAIVADLPPDEGAPLEGAFTSHDLALVYLVAPTSSPDRVALIGERAGGFVYCVSLAGVTGARRTGPRNLGALVARVKKSTPLPVAVGFGVSKPEHVRAVTRAGGDGVAVGSALIDALGPDGRDEAAFMKLCADLAGATRSARSRAA
jgi:tryptophan synthase alpha chain